MSMLQAIAAALPQPNNVTAHTEGTITVEFIDGTVKQYEGYYISYNVIDRSYYGSNTTAIVIGQMQLFFILKGDHTREYSNKTLEQALQYYKDNIRLSTKSDNINKIVSIMSN